MSEPGSKPHRAGGPITDLCRACKVLRDHTVIAVESGRAVRVACDFCGSQHNYRGGGEEPDPRIAPAARPPVAAAPRLAASRQEKDAARHPGPEGSVGGSTSEDHDGIEALLRRVLREELGFDGTTPAPKWRGGQLVLRPGRPGLQEKTWPVDALFHKIVMIRNRLRTLEQQLNAAELPEDLKLRLQSYVSACYGSLTSFNVLFSDEADQFRGSGGSD